MANVVWPALYLETRLLSWWAIAIGLLVEYFYYLKVLKFNKRQALKANLFANLVSAVLGIVLIPALGIAWELFPASVYQFIFDWGTFNPITWIASFCIAAVFNALIEGFVIKKFFYSAFTFRGKTFYMLVMFNAVSVGAALISLLIEPVRV